MSDQFNTPNAADDFDEIFENAEPVTTQPSQGQISIRTTTGDTRFVLTNTPLTMAEVISRSGLNTNGVSQYWMNGIQVTDLTTVVPVGGNITLATSVKGG